MQDQTSSDEYRERLNTFSQEFDLGLFVHLLRKSLVWVLGVLILTFVLSRLYLYYTPQIYEASAILQIQEDDAANKILDVRPIGEENGIDAKVELIRSNLLIGQCLESFPLEVSYYTQGEILSSERYVLSPYRVEIIEKRTPAIEGKQIPIQFNGDEFTITVREKTYGPLKVGEVIDLEFLAFRVIVVQPENLSELQERDQLYFVINNKNELIRRFSKGMNVRISNNTARTIQIAYRDQNILIARDFVDALSREFIRFDLERRQRSDEKILNFIDTQIDTVFDRLKLSEVGLNNYKQENKISDLSQISNVYLDRLNEIEKRLVELDIEKGLLDEVEELTNSDSEQIGVYNLVPLMAGSRYEFSLTKLLNNLHQLTLRKEEALYSVTPDNNLIEGLDYQIGIQKELIVRTIVSLRDKVDAEREDLNGKLKEIETVYLGLPSKELEFARLQRLFSINEKYYTMLLEKRIEYQISREGFVPKNEILEEARMPDKPISPKRGMITVSFLLVGLFIGFIIISIRYLMHNKIASLHEINKVSNSTISTLGIVPKYKESIPLSMLLIDKSPKSVFAESFRNIRTNMQFIANHDGPKMVGVTSTISGEGKTMVAINLAGIISMSNKRVILLDLDMRKPKINKGFEVDNTKGMSTVLIGKDHWKDTVRKSRLENLDFITAGPVPPNPSELIISEKMDEILNELKGEYDYIVMDTPPAGLVTDSIALIQKVDYPLYIFKSDYSHKNFVQNVDRIINENKVSNLSVILNGVDLSRNRYGYNYGYGYTYGYGYGYGNGYYDESAPKKSWFKRMFSK
ncbi:MAG: polysaccharide biosynthesis tyrosine autokinase [Flavobacteriales bacterium]|nr:polysaccharide biosynthesis tyrosine autokinase [Flavobacteriales bacterium]